MKPKSSANALPSRRDKKPGFDRRCRRLLETLPNKQTGTLDMAQIQNRFEGVSPDLFQRENCFGVDGFCWGVGHIERRKDTDDT